MDTFNLTDLKTLEVLAPSHLDYAFEKTFDILNIIKDNFKGNMPTGFCTIDKEEDDEELLLVIYWLDNEELAVELKINKDGDIDIWMYELGIEDHDGLNLYFETDKDVADYISKILERFLITKDKSLDSELKEVELNNRQKRFTLKLSGWKFKGNK